MSHILGMSKGAMSGNSRDLIDLGVLHETETVRGQGRPSILLDFNPHFATFGGAFLHVDHGLMIFNDLNGKILARETIPRRFDQNEMAGPITDALENLIAQRPHSTRNKLAGIGITISGAIETNKSNRIQSPPLGTLVRQRANIDTYIENDATAVAIFEKLFGSCREIQNFAVISLGDSIGCAQFINGMLYRGKHGDAGKFAHSTVEPGGLPCRCGKRGCLETIASTKAVMGLAWAENIECSSIMDIENKAAKGNKAAINVLHRAGSAFGLAIANLIQINDPGIILIVHRGCFADGLFRTVFNQTVEANILPRFAGHTPIITRHINDDDLAQSAGGVAAYNFLLGLTTAMNTPRVSQRRGRQGAEP